MAVDPRLPASPLATRPLPGATPSSVERVEAWTVSQAADALAATSIADPITPSRPSRGMTVTIDISLDEETAPARPLRLDATPSSRAEAVHTVYKRRTPIRRDSQNRREALLKGKEGSRRRQRWENKHLIGNPIAQEEPPLPIDWNVTPTYPVHRVPYAIAPLWDAGYKKAAQERAKKEREARVPPQSPEEAVAAKVTRDLRAKLKRARGAKGLLQDLETEVRGFVEEWDRRRAALERDGVISASGSEASGSEIGGDVSDDEEAIVDDEDEEIVFVGRNAAASLAQSRDPPRASAKLEKDRLIFESLVDDHGAAFGRYLVHAIGAYYGLKTWSVTTGNPARREAYVGFDVDPALEAPVLLGKGALPRPLWAVV